jgi:hypothetical protein
MVIWHRVRDHLMVGAIQKKPSRTPVRPSRTRVDPSRTCRTRGRSSNNGKTNTMTETIQDQTNAALQKSARGVRGLRARHRSARALRKPGRAGGFRPEHTSAPQELLAFRRVFLDARALFIRLTGGSSSPAGAAGRALLSAGAGQEPASDEAGAGGESTTDATGCASPIGRYDACVGTCGCMPKTQSPQITKDSAINECGDVTPAKIVGTVVSAWGETAQLSADGTALFWADGSAWGRHCAWLGR